MFYMAKRIRRMKSRKAYRVKLKKSTVYSISQIIFFALAILVIASFSRQGSILAFLNDSIISYFGWTALFLPFIFLSFGFVLSKFKIPLSQPNVIVGILLFFISIGSLTRAGLLGATSWEGVVGLVTPIGAYVILSGTTLVGLVVMFNTSLYQVASLLATFLRQVRFYVMGEKKLGKINIANGKRELKVIGGGNSLQTQNNKLPSPAQGSLAPKLVSNLPGEKRVWRYPPTTLLTQTQSGHADRGDIKGNAQIIEQTLDSFGVTARVIEVSQGPAVTQYALEVALGTKLSKITTLERDMARALASPTGTIRIEAPIPGRNLVGIELPNRSPEFVPLKKMIESEVMKDNKSKLAVALGFDVTGKAVIGDIGKMPHVLIAGQTGSGKSVCINTFLTSLLFRASPSEVKFILVDPKRVELTHYNGIPHLLSPVIVEPEKVLSALRWTMSEMDRRYKLFAEAGARNIDGYNEMSGFQALPYIVLFIDELADIMLFSPVEVEDAITRIAQMSRATGIHMVLATQRPSVDVITGLIKANVPSRIAFAVSSLIDSRVILDTTGAEKLLGKGDMLYLPPESAKPSRIQGAYISDKEVSALVTFLKNQGVTPQYTEEVTTMVKSGSGSALMGGGGGETDDLFRQSVEIITQSDKASASLLQRKLSIGYARAARILDQLEQAGVVDKADGAKPRKVLINDASALFPNNEG